MVDTAATGRPSAESLWCTPAAAGDSWSWGTALTEVLGSDSSDSRGISVEFPRTWCAAEGIKRTCRKVVSANWARRRGDSARRHFHGDAQSLLVVVLGVDSVLLDFAEQSLLRN